MPEERERRKRVMRQQAVFPVVVGPESVVEEPGLDREDFFAAVAMGALLITHGGCRTADEELCRRAWEIGRMMCDVYVGINWPEPPANENRREGPVAPPAGTDEELIDLGAPIPPASDR